MKLSDKSIMSEPLPVGLICLLGPQGSGKTSKGMAYLINDFKYHGKERFKKSQEFTNELNRNGYNLHLPKNKVLYFCSEKSVLSKKPYLETWYLDPTKFALPNLDFEVQYFPRFSVIYIPEFDNVLNCRDWETLSPYFIALAKYARQWDLTIIVDLQVFLQMDVSWRRLVMYTDFILESYWKAGPRKSYDKKPKWFFWFKPKRKWKSVWVDNQRNNFAKDLSSMLGAVPLVKKLMTSTVSSKKYVFKNNIFNYYDSFSGKSLFLRYIKDYKFVKHEDNTLSPENVEKFCQKHPIVRPKEVNKR